MIKCNYTMHIWLGEKMKKLLVLLLIFGIFACSCASTSDVTIQNKAPNELPEHQEGYIAYVINKETGTYHLPSCSFAQKMDEGKKDYWYFDEEHLYSFIKLHPCQNCITWRKNQVT